MSTNVFIGFGSNLGDRKANIEEALRLGGFKIARTSSLYETEPVGFVNQPWFVNCVVEIESDLAPLDLLRICQSVEQKLLRKREIPKGPRTIDLDILFYGTLIVHDPDLVIPHPAIQDRLFVLQPMNEIAPNFVHPLLKKTISQLLAQCSDHSQIRRLDNFPVK
jgi:2-amino-4-hydroxy-6-hydroxymethyldihydropteridine diphosphokinase